jgi:hypothetical protein
MKIRIHTVLAMGVLFCLIGASSTAWGQISFNSGTLVVVRYGDGSGTLNSTATPVFLDKYQTDGTFVHTTGIPTVASGSNAPLTVAGSAISEGYINRSTDGLYIFLGGYGAAVGTASIATTASATYNRVIARLDAYGNIDITTKLSDAFSGKNIRSVASIDGNAFWASGADDGVRYAALGATTSTVVSSTYTNLRVINIFNNQLYVSSSASSVFGVVAVGTGVPTSTGNTSTLLSGFPTASLSSYGFSINSAANIIYLADDGATASGGGLQKWTYSGSTWTLAYTLSSNLTTGLRGILVDWSGVNPVIYVTDAGTSANKLLVVTDDGSSASFSTLATAPTYTAFRGLTFSPTTTAVPVEMTSFTASMQGANSAILKWNTATEVNNNGFEIERRAVNSDQSSVISWQKVGFVAGAGTSNAPKDYSFTDNGLTPGMHVYRIKQIDNDGIFKYSASVQVDAGVTGKSFELLSNYPNPFNPATEIRFSVPEDGYASLKVYNMLGQEVATLFNGMAQSGHYIAATFNAGNMASGLYFSRLEYNGKSLVQRMLLTK